MERKVRKMFKSWINPFIVEEKDWKRGDKGGNGSKRK